MTTLLEIAILVAYVLGVALAAVLLASLLRGLRR